MHVWAVDRPANAAAAEALWAKLSEEERGNFDPRSGVTIYYAADDATPEQLCLEALPKIEEHHSPPLADEPWTALEAYGVELTDAIKEALSDLGFVRFRATDEGFTCSR